MGREWTPSPHITSYQLPVLNAMTGEARLKVDDALSIIHGKIVLVIKSVSI